MMMLNLSQLSDWESRDVTLGETQFVISPLLPMEGFAVLEEIRENIRPGMSFGPGDDEGSLMLLGVSLLTSLPARTVKSVQGKMFAAVVFTRPNSLTPRPLAGNEGTAFMELTPYRVYEMTLRCLAVNFSESFRELLSLRLELAPQPTAE